MPPFAGALVPVAAAAVPLLVACRTASAQGVFAHGSILRTLRSGDDAWMLSIIMGLALFSVVTALLHLSGRHRGVLREAGLLSALNEARAKLDRAETFLAAEPQITVVWSLTTAEPDIEGDVGLLDEASHFGKVLDFDAWLPIEQAQRLDGAVARLRERGETFRLSAVTLSDRILEVDGRAVSGRAVMRIRDVSGDRLEASRLRETQARTSVELEALRSLVDAVPCPTWERDASGRLTWINNAYVRAVEANGKQDTLLRGIELLETQAREAVGVARARREVYRGRAAAVVAGWRRSLDIVEVPHAERSVGMAFDMSELEATRVDLAQTIQAHARTLDQLSTAVAIFDRRKQLVFHNSAYRQLWSLEQDFLETSPSESEILDLLRARRLLPEQADFRGWKEAHLAGYQSPETVEQVWYLPDGRTLRAVINPNPQSGITYLFDDVSAQFHLESQFNAQSRVQTETLDTLKEGVAVFGTDGRLKLANAAFARIWRIAPPDLAAKPHIDAIAAICSQYVPDPAIWSALRTAVAGFHDQRTGTEVRLACRDGSIFDCAVAPLPDGATLLTFTDTTASANVERALTERNQALLDAEKLRNDFVHHVSYELRSPLTNIIGFIQLLGDGAVGSLNPKQGEYVGYIMKSSAALLAIINDILDLATIDTGALELNLKRVDVLDAIRSAAEGIQDRLAESALNLQVVALPDIGSFQADAKRLRQILFNLLSNAVGFSSPGQTVTLAALRRGDDLVFKVSDQGRGIPDDVIAHVFDRFHSTTIGSRHRGVGLGLSIVKSFVELHGGRVLIDSMPGQGTTVTCIFPTHDDSVALDGEVRETMNGR